MLPEPRHQRDPRADNASKYEGEETCLKVRLLAQEGMFPEEWCAHIGITMSTLYNWANEHEEFERAVLESWYLLRAYWTKKARESKLGVGIPPTVLLRILETRFPDTWGKNPRNTQDNFEGRDGKPVDPDEEQANLDQSPEALRAMSDDDLSARIKALEARRQHDGGK